jgi:hypothetical protein
VRAPALLLVAAAGLAPVARAEPPPPEGRAFVEVAASAAEVFVGEPFTLALRVGVDAEWFEAHAVPLFPAPLDLPVHVEAPGFLEAATPAAAGGEPAGAPVRFALGDAPVVARREALPEVRGDGPAFQVASVVRRVVADVPGRVALAAPRLRFAYATEFHDDLVRGRVPVDAHEVSVAGAPVEVVVRPLPTEGKPEGHTGAVGRFELRAETDARRVEVGEPFALRLRITGEGNLASFGTPRPSLSGFHLLGVRDDRETPVRTVTLDLAATGARVTEVPPIALASFDPQAREWRTVRSAPLPLEVTAGAGAPASATPARGGGRAAGFPFAVLVGFLAGLAVLVALLLRMRAR